jgi:spermidine/putrescine transport system permease protein
MRRWLTDPWRKPRLLEALVWGYLAWSILPVAIAVWFSFNAGRSRSSWQGFSLRWYWEDPVLSVWHDPDLQRALLHSLRLAVLTTLVAVPSGSPSPSAWTAGGAGWPPASTSRCC